MLRSRVEDGVDDIGHLRPLGRINFELAAACRREAIKLRAAIIFRLSPLALNPSLMLDSIESDIEGALRDLKSFSRDLLDAQ